MNEPGIPITDELQAEMETWTKGRLDNLRQILEQQWYGGSAQYVTEMILFDEPIICTCDCWPVDDLGARVIDRLLERQLQ